MEVINPNDFKVSVDDSPFSETFFYEDTCAEHWKTFVNKTKRLIRSSYEYSLFINHCKNNNELRRCAYLSNINDEMASIEIHHSPFTMHDIVEIVAESKLNQGLNINTLLIGQEVLALHFHDYIGIVPLTITNHQMVHAGKLKIHFSQIFGKVSDFVTMYKNGLTKQHAGKLLAFVKYGESTTVMEMVRGRFKFAEDSGFVDNGLNAELLQYLLSEKMLNKEVPK